jgi:hypothetical protein
MDMWLLFVACAPRHQILLIHDNPYIDQQYEGQVRVKVMDP